MSSLDFYWEFAVKRNTEAPCAETHGYVSFMIKVESMTSAGSKNAIGVSCLSWLVECVTLNIGVVGSSLTLSVEVT